MRSRQTANDADQSQMVAKSAVSEKVAASLAEKRRIVVSFDNRPNPLSPAVPLSPALDATLMAATLQNESAVRVAIRQIPIAIEKSKIGRANLGHL